MAKRKRSKDNKEWATLKCEDEECIAAVDRAAGEAKSLVCACSERVKADISPLTTPLSVGAGRSSSGPV